MRNIANKSGYKLRSLKEINVLELSCILLGVVDYIRRYG